MNFIANTIANIITGLAMTVVFLASLAAILVELFFHPFTTLVVLAAVIFITSITTD